jgi:glycosyltransferase involved in cell wall biosynthesis
MTDNYAKLSSLSLFYPAYNEAGNIAESIQQALMVLPSVAEKFEIIVVDDGSSDATYQIAQRFSFEHPVVRVVTQPNTGYGGALKRGFAEAKYDWVFFTDSDLQFDLSQLLNFLPHANNHDIILGYRLSRAEGWKRIFLAKLLKIWAVVFFGLSPKIKDIDCAFKLIRLSVIREIEPLFSDGAMISTELLVKALHLRYRYVQVGVDHYQRFSGEATGSKLGVLFQALVDSFSLKIELMRSAAKRTAGYFLHS